MNKNISFCWKWHSWKLQNTISSQNNGNKNFISNRIWRQRKKQPTNISKSNKSNFFWRTVRHLLLLFVLYIEHIFFMHGIMTFFMNSWVLFFKSGKREVKKKAFISSFLIMITFRYIEIDCSACRHEHDKSDIWTESMVKSILNAH